MRKRLKFIGTFVLVFLIIVSLNINNYSENKIYAEDNISVINEENTQIEPITKADFSMQAAFTPLIGADQIGQFDGSPKWLDLEATTTFSVYLQAGESLRVQGSLTAGQGAYVNYVDSDTTTDGFQAQAVADDATHMIDVIVKGPSGTVFDTTTGNEGLDISNTADILDHKTGTVTESGIYTFSVKNRSGFTIGLNSTGASNAISAYRSDWAFAVLGSDGITIKPGRIWTEALNLYQNTAFATTTLYTVSDSGYQYELTLNNYNGAYSTLKFSSLGTVDASGNPLNTSVALSTASNDLGSDGKQYVGPVSTSGLYKIFFSSLSEDLPEEIMPTPIDSGTTPIGKITGFEVTGVQPRAGEIMHWLSSRFVGSYKVLIDTNDNGVYTDDVDVSLDATAQGGDANGTSTDPIGVAWNGLDGENQPVAFDQTINSRIQIDNASQIYITMRDVEGLDGLSLKQINGSGAGNTNVYWNDPWAPTQTNPGTAGVTNNGTPAVTYPTVIPMDGAGTDSSGGVHGWATGTLSWGDNRIIQTMMRSGFSESSLIATEDEIPADTETDHDHDGIPDTEEMGTTTPVDTDNDGVADWMDTDSDDDGIPDEVEAGEDPTNPIDTDEDGTPDYQDLDSDDDGIPDEVEAGEDPTNPIDTDEDGTPDYQDLDSDDDGIRDIIEAGEDPENPVDTDEDGTPD
jgi:hypothetical protein